MSMFQFSAALFQSPIEAMAVLPADGMGGMAELRASREQLDGIRLICNGAGWSILLPM
jgi:hypothetical protein